MTVNTSTKNTPVGTPSTTSDTTTTDTTTNDVSGDTKNNNTLFNLFGGGELMNWLSVFAKNKKSVSENKTKHKINEDINRIKDLMRKNL